MTSHIRLIKLMSKYNKCQITLKISSAVIIKSKVGLKVDVRNAFLGEKYLGFDHIN